MCIACESSDHGLSINSFNNNVGMDSNHSEMTEDNNSLKNNNCDKKKLKSNLETIFLQLILFCSPNEGGVFEYNNHNHNHNNHNHNHSRHNRNDNKGIEDHSTIKTCVTQAPLSSSFVKRCEPIDLAVGSPSLNKTILENQRKREKRALSLMSTTSFSIKTNCRLDISRTSTSVSIPLT
eukprot:Pgem_evm1s9960